MANSLAEIPRSQQNFIHFLHPLSPGNKTFVSIQEKHHKNRNRSTFSVLFNKTCIKEGL